MVKTSFDPLSFASLKTSGRSIKGGSALLWWVLTLKRVF